MKWRTHQVCGLGFAALMHAPIFALFSACLGSILPDILDQRISGLFSSSKRGKQYIFNNIHRGLSHWFALWFGVYALCYYPQFPHIVRECCLGLGIGGFLHVVLDMLTPKGVPFLPFTPFRLSIPICRTGSLLEHIFLVLFLVAFVYLWQSDLWHVFLFLNPLR